MTFEDNGDYNLHLNYKEHLELDVRPEKGENEAVSKFAHLYKSVTTFINQEDRRKTMLLELKRRRTVAIDEKRNLEDIFEDDFEEDISEETELENNFTKKKTYSLFRNRLMLSEWFKEIPSDLEQNWLFKLCPSGKRSLIVATKNITTAYNRKGAVQCYFKSFLPGGGAKYVGDEVFTVLDCVFNRRARCYFVLDVLAWNSYSVKGCDTEFRTFWLKSKLEENPELEQSSPCNKYPLVFLDSFPAELPLIEDALSRPYSFRDIALKLDGILFYHRMMFYKGGLTPLVGWLKPYMVPEMLGVPVHESFMLEKPKGYVSLHNYLERISNQYGKSRRRKLKDEEMETVEILDTENSEPIE